MDNSSKEKIYKESDIPTVKGVEMAKVLIATVYSAVDPVMLTATKLGIDRLIMVIDNKPDATQKKSFELIKKALGNVIEIKTIKTEVYDIVKIAEEIVKAIDLLSDKDQIFVNITASRKTQALGLLYAAYTRINRIKQIVYVIENQNKLVYLPKLSYNLNNSQRTILEHIDKYKVRSHSDFSEKLKISRGMLYRTITELQDLGLIIQDEEEGFKLTDAGRIAIL